MGPTGKEGVYFCHDKSKVAELSIPCGKCTGCYLERGRQWSMRCMHEASLYDRNCVVTLTFNDVALKAWCPSGSLSKRVFPLFMKRLRKAALFDGIKFFHAAEYGGDKLRPHHHALLFNCDFDDKKKLFKTGAGSVQYVSPTLTELWGNGHATIGELNSKSAAYVARYCLKKAQGRKLPEHLAPEFCTMSRGGRDGHGIGYEWYQEFKSDCFPSDFLLFNGAKVKPPRYYDYLLSKERPEFLSYVKSVRMEHAGPVVSSVFHPVRGMVEIRQGPDATPARLADREFVKEQQISRLRRSLEA